MERPAVTPNAAATGRLFGWEGERFEAYFWFVGWDCISFGVHVCLSLPNIELHVPFGFMRIGASPQQRTT